MTQTGLGFLLVLAVSAVVASTALASHVLPGPASGNGVTPTGVHGNPSCADLLGAGDFLFEFKLEPVVSGTFPLSFDGLSGSVTVTVNNTPQGQTFDFSFSGDFVASAVIVKGGPDANFYDYRPAGEDADTGLHAPINPSNNRFYGLSHISFCVMEAADGAIQIEKRSTKSGNPLVSTAGAVFSYDGFSVTDNGAGDEDNTVGVVCVSGLDVGDYTVNETTPPSGYGDAGESDVTATAVSGTNCTDNKPTGSGIATFTNPPLYDLQVNFRDGGSGETSVTSITCEDIEPPDSTDPADGWDASNTYLNEEAPDTVVCTIVVDP